MTQDLTNLRAAYDALRAEPEPPAVTPAWTGLLDAVEAVLNPPSIDIDAHERALAEVLQAVAAGVHEDNSVIIIVTRDYPNGRFLDTDAHLVIPDQRHDLDLYESAARGHLAELSDAAGSLEEDAGYVYNIAAGTLVFHNSGIDHEFDSRVSRP